MSSGAGSRPELVRPEFGPSLPALVRTRLGVPERVTAAFVAAVVVVLAVAAALIVVRGDGTKDLVDRSAPAFTMAYAPGALEVGEPRPGERLRLSGRRDGVSVDVVVRALRLPPFRGNVASGLLPSYAAHYVDRLRRSRGRFVLRDEGNMTLGTTPGYQLGFRTGPPARRSYWREILLVPEDDGGRVGVILSLRHVKPGTAAYTDADRDYVVTAKRALRSFRFGTERPAGT
jgi:hypothetical protein